MKPYIFTLYAGLMIGITAQAQTFSWAKQVGGTSDDIGLSMALDAAGNHYVTGYFTGTVDFDPGPGTFTLSSTGENDVFVLKLDATGNFVWAKQMGGTTGDGGASIKLDPAGNIYLTGSFSGIADFDPGPAVYNLYSNGSWDIFICKLNPSGDFLWAKAFGGSTQEDHGHAIAVDDNGNVYLTGTFKGYNIDFDPGAGTCYISSDYIDAFVSKLDASGNFVWAKKIGGWATDIGYAITLDAAGNIYITGSFRAGGDFDPGPGTAELFTYGDSDEFICKFDASGNLVWAKQTTSGPIDYSYANSIAVDAASNVYTTGAFKGTTDFNPGPQTFNMTANGLNDIFVSKLNAAGDFVWAKQLGGCQNEEHGASIAVDVVGNVYSTGVFQYEADFDPGPGTYSLYASGGTDVYVSKLNPSGNFIWAKKIGGTSTDHSYAIVLDAYANIYITGQFAGTADFDPGSATYNLVSAGGADIFIQKLSSGLVIPLPVKFDNVKASLQGNGIRLEWSNLTEFNVINYSIERAGATQPFETLLQVPASKNDGGEADYSYFDASPLDGINLYRVRSLDADGQTLYSVIVRVDIKGNKTGITVYPNPVVGGQLCLQFNELPKGDYFLKVFNANGQEVYNRQLNMNSGSVSEVIQLPASLKAGMYYLQVINAGLKTGNRFVMQ